MQSCLLDLIRVDCHFLNLVLCFPASVLLFPENSCVSVCLLYQIGQILSPTTHAEPRVHHVQTLLPCLTLLLTSSHCSFPVQWMDCGTHHVFRIWGCLQRAKRTTPYIPACKVQQCKESLLPKEEMKYSFTHRRFGRNIRLSYPV